MPTETVLIASKYHVFVAGLIGSVLGATFNRRQSPIELTLAIFGGLAASNYFAPVVINYFNVYENPEAVGFFVGLIGMNLISGFLTLSEYWSRNAAIVVGNYINKKVGKEIIPVKDLEAAPLSSEKDVRTTRREKKDPHYKGPERRN